MRNFIRRRAKKLTNVSPTSAPNSAPHLAHRSPASHERIYVSTLGGSRYERPVREWLRRILPSYRDYEIDELYVVAEDPRIASAGGFLYVQPGFIEHYSQLRFSLPDMVNPASYPPALLSPETAS